MTLTMQMMPTITMRMTMTIMLLVIDGYDDGDGGDDIHYFAYRDCFFLMLCLFSFPNLVERFVKTLLVDAL